MRTHQASRLPPSWRHPPSPARTLISAAVVAALAAPAAAQLQFDELPRRGLPVQNDNTKVVALGDVDGDGDLDLVVGNDGQTRLHLGDGAGGFTHVTASHMPADNDNGDSLALGDVDGDGDLDIVLGNYGGCSLAVGCPGQQNRLYLNDGTGHFTDATSTNMPVDSDYTTGLALGDVDGDGDLDIVFANGGFWSPWGQQDRLYLNDGSGTFIDATRTNMPAMTLVTKGAVVLGDVDGDGDLDMVLGGGGYQWNTPYSTYLVLEPNLLYLNDGSGVFAIAPGQMPANTGNNRALALGDVDGDGDLDLLVAKAALYFNTASLQDDLYLNDGSGTFTDVTAALMPVHAVDTHQAAFGDIDGDGDLDIVFGSGVGLLVNDGSGHFTDVTTARIAATAGRPALGDVDADGDLDIVFGNNGQNRLYLNLLRQLDAPLPLRIGRAYSLDVYARYGPPSLVDVALPYLSTGTASIALPFGTVGIDPTRMVALSPFVVPRPAGAGSVGYAVPNLAGLVGIPVYGQALLLRYPFPERLTNVTADVVVP